MTGNGASSFPRSAAQCLYGVTGLALLTLICFRLGLDLATSRPGRYVRLTVEDSGSGMDDATLSRITEPFFTTKEVGRGTGPGLSLVYAIITDLAGAIDVKSAPAPGSTFAIYLPLAEIAVASATEAEGPLAPADGERALFVDDVQP